MTLTFFFDRAPYVFTVGLGAKRSIPNTDSKKGFFSGAAFLAASSVPTRPLSELGAKAEATAKVVNKTAVFMVKQVGFSSQK